MKNLFYSVYAVLFNLSRRLFKIQKNRVALVSMHNENFNDSLGAVHEELKNRGGFSFVFITREDLSLKNPFKLFSFFFIKSRLLATSEYIFLNDNFLPMGKLNFRAEAVITQLWHAEGAFKKFGLHIPQPENVRNAELKANEKLSYVVCSSEGTKKIYAEAFCMKEERVLALGAPRADYLMKEENKTEALNEIHALYPKTKNKKILLYAPTFRDEESQNSAILKKFDIELLKNAIGEEYEIFIRLHPQIHAEEREFKGAEDVTDFYDVRKLILASDVLVTDYSSICMNFAFLNKKCIFYAYDLDWYKNRRDFYFDYESFVPGEIAKTIPELIEAIKKEPDKERLEKFRHFNFDYFDAESAKRTVDKIIFGINP